MNAAHSDRSDKPKRRRGGVAPQGARKAAATARAAGCARTMSVRGASAYSGWPPSTIRALVHKGHLPVVYLPSDAGHKHMWLLREDVDAAIERWTERLA